MRSKASRLKIRNIDLLTKPRIVLSIDDSIEMDVLKKIKGEGVDILEVRVDKFNKIDKDYVLKFVSLIRKSRFPIIVTIRKIEEGGKKFISDDNRLELFKSVTPLVDVIDIELNSKDIIEEVIKIAHDRGKLVIISYHNFKETPKQQALKNTIKKAKKLGGDIVKIATFAKSKEDVLELVNFTIKNKDENIITISLGKKGLISRVFFPFIGSLFTYTFIDKPFVPSQLPLKLISEEFRRYYNK